VIVKIRCPNGATISPLSPETPSNRTTTHCQWWRHAIALQPIIKSDAWRDSR
jgi:hypothetical protein